MKVRLLTLFVALIGATTLVAQDIHRCGTVEYIDHLDSEYPGFSDVVDQTYQQQIQYMLEQQTSRTTWDTIFRIPVVFHVVFENSTENIHDSIIFSQLDVLNEDFRRLNADTVNTRDTFLHVAGDAGIEFYIPDVDTVDGQGNPITVPAITRTSGNSGPFGWNLLQDNVKSKNQGGVNPWDTDNYLNIWICNLDILGQTAVLGYAFPPAGTPNWPPGAEAPSPDREGVVVHYEVVGRNNPLATGPLSATDRGRTCTHEVGHFLGLRHIWGDGGCNEDDGLSDTPFSDDASQQMCNLNRNSCTDSPIDYPDMIENYMDYSRENCMNMFTMQQIAVMRAALVGPRADLPEIQRTTPPPPPTSIVETEELKLKLYPNPANESVRLEWDAQKETVLELFDITGRLIEAENIIRNNHQLETADLDDGIYVLRLTTDGKSVSRKLTIQH